MLKKLAKSSVYAGLRPFFRLIAPRPHGRKRVLFYCHSLLTATYLQEIWELLRDDPRLDFYLCLRRPEHHAGDWKDCRALLPIPEVSERWGSAMPWDLVVLADHSAFPAITAPWRHAVLRIAHGIGGKKQANGQDFFFGDECFDWKGRLLYSCLFESSYSRLRQAQISSPVVAKRISVIGSLRADRIAAAIDRRQRTNGDVARKPHVLIASSWEKGNLLDRCGEDLLAVAKKHLSDFDFTLRPHPHFLRTDWDNGTNWRQGFETVSRFETLSRSGIAFSRPTESTESAIARADVVVTDDLSSLGLLTVLAGGRVVIVPSFSPNVGTDTFLARLRKCTPNLQSPTQLASVIRNAIRTWPPAGLSELVSDMNGEPGRAAYLARCELYRLLQLASPAQPVVAPILPLAEQGTLG